MSTRGTVSFSTTKNGTFWFCRQKPSCEYFCPDQNCYMYTKAVAAFRESGCLHPVCPAHQRYAKLCVVKDKMKQSYGRPFFVYSERKNPCKFWQSGDIFENLRPLCLHGLMCCKRKVRIVYFIALRKATLVISSRGSNKSLVWSILASCCFATHLSTDTKSKRRERRSIALRLTLEKPHSRLQQTLHARVPNYI